MAADSPPPRPRPTPPGGRGAVAHPATPRDEHRGAPLTAEQFLRMQAARIADYIRTGKTGN